MDEVRVNGNELEKFAINILCAAGVDTYESEIISKVLVWTDMVGRTTHGMIRLPIYIKRFRRGLIKSPCHPKFIHKTSSIQILKGNDGFGQFLSHCAMSKAIEIAAKQGVGLIGVYESNHFGAGAYYIQMAAEKNMISFVTTNSFPLVAPHGGIAPVFGTNPMAFGAPMRNNQSILVDFSTGALAGATIRRAIAENGEIPKGMVVDEKGQDIVDPKKAPQGIILPFAGARGYCLGLMVEILSGVITGSAISHEIGSIFRNFQKSNRVGHLFIALDISQMIPLYIYYDRMTQLVAFIKETKRLDETVEILLPGEKRWHLYQQHMKDGIRLSADCIEALNPLADELGVTKPWNN
jgi:LDH2 family malate/lactate/ureidoglycolate dehydrogenase